MAVNNNIKFGFSVSKGRQIFYDTNEKSIANFIYEREPSFRLCIECGGCAATCTSGNFTRFSLRELNILIKRGENEAVRERIHRCMLCGKCILVCPRGVNTRNVVMLARQAIQKSNINEV
jgi:heterodisulfide reductase subunit C